MKHLLTSGGYARRRVRRRRAFLVAGAVKQGGKQVSARIDSLARWHELWKLPPTRSVEGVIRFGDRPSATAALRLLAVDDPSGPVPVAGAAADRLGTGPACPTPGAAGE